MEYNATDSSIVQEESEGSREQPWKQKCSFGCYHAKGKRKKCKCRCRGKLHGGAIDEHNEKLRLAELEEPCVE